jgi:hypothetical protein
MIPLLVHAYVVLISRIRGTLAARQSFAPGQTGELLFLTLVRRVTDEGAESV